MPNLIAYIPVLNRQYLDWLKKHEPFNLFLISRHAAEYLVPHLARNLGALTEVEIKIGIDSLIQVGSLRGRVRIYEGLPSLGLEVLMPDDDVSRKFQEACVKHDPKYVSVTLEPVWGRWDMTAVKRQEPVVVDCEVSLGEAHWQAMNIALKEAVKSPDWWRQVGAAAFEDGELLAVGFNQHFPTEYEAAVFGDPRINFDAGDPAGAGVYLSLHAERVVIAKCARQGIALGGASLFVTTFPCPDCCRMIVASGIREVFFFEGYSVLKGLETLRAHGIRVVQLKSPGSA